MKVVSLEWRNSACKRKMILMLFAKLTVEYYVRIKIYSETNMHFLHTNIIITNFTYHLSWSSSEVHDRCHHYNYYGNHDMMLLAVSIMMATIVGIIANDVYKVRHHSHNDYRSNTWLRYLKTRPFEWKLISVIMLSVVWCLYYKLTWKASHGKGLLTFLMTTCWRLNDNLPLNFVI